MDTTLNTPIGWTDKALNQSKVASTENKLTAFINSQAKYETAWFLVSMITQGIFFLPVPAVLIFNFDAPVYILLFTLSLFFANIIAGMSNAGVKVIIYLFAASVVLHALLLAIFTL